MNTAKRKKNVKKANIFVRFWNWLVSLFTGKSKLFSRDIGIDLGTSAVKLLLMDGEELVSFVTLTGQDAVRDETLTPWIGFVFTQPACRGHRYAGLLLNHAEREAAGMGYGKIYICTDHIGLYEKYGYTWQENRVDFWGDDVQVFYKNLEE